MGASVALCIDEMTYRNPELVGLGGEALDSQAWLDVLQSGEEARAHIAASDSIVEAWVVSSEDVEPVNLAATLKSDRPNLCVRLVSFEGGGSLFSRAHTALIDEVADQALFLRRYADAKLRYSSLPALDAAGSEPDVKPKEAPVLLADPILPDVERRPAEQPVLGLSAISKGNRAFLMPVVSGSGGAGKSSVSVMSALIASASGHRTLLLDYDLQFGDVKVMCGQPDALTINEALAHPDRFEREISRGAGLVVLAAPDRLETAEDVVKAMPEFLERVSSMFDAIIANTGAAWAEQHAVLLERSSAALFLIDQRASSVRACRHALELCERCGIASRPFQYALNRCAKNASLTSADVSNALQGAPVFEIKEGGHDVEDYLSAGAAADLLELRNDFCTSLEYIMGRLLPGTQQRFETRLETVEDRRPAKRRGFQIGRKRGRDAQ